MSRIHRAKFLRIPSLVAVLMCFPCPTWAASQAGNLLPAETDVIVTCNPREIVRDYRDTPFVQRYLDQWRLAVKGDEQQLLKYYDTQEILSYEGISRKEFLERASSIKSGFDALGIASFEDVESITFGCALGDKGYFAVVIEGKFKQRNTMLLEPFFKKHLFPVNQGDGPLLSVLDNTTLVYADSTKTLEAIQARAGKKTSVLPPGVQILLESGRKEHLSVVVNHLDTHAQRLTKFLREELSTSIGIDHPIGKLIAGQGPDWLAKAVVDYDAVSFGISIRDESTRLQFGLNAKKAKKAEELRALLNTGSFWGGLALRAIDHDLARQLAGILGQQRVLLKETTLIVHFTVPHALIVQVLQNPLLSIVPELHQAKTKPLPGQEVLETLAQRVTSFPVWKSGIAGADIEEVRDVAYKTGPGSDPYRNRLDMFLPKNKKDFPVVVLVHGGGWDMGDKSGAGLYSSVGQFLASQGIGAVLPNYRLSPAVKHPEHVRDVARAVAWTQSHVEKYGGDPKRLYLVGHSAGGHIVALLATDESYLKAEGMKSSDIKGVIPVSGVYRIPDGVMHGALGGLGPRALRLEQMLPLRGASAPSLQWNIPGVPVDVDIFGPIFGDSNKQRAEASPITHIHRGMPPFLILSAEHDLPTLAPMADEFHAALREKGYESRLLRVPKRNHSSIMFSAFTANDPVAQAIIEFVRK